MPSAEVARLAYEGMMAGKRVVIPGAAQKLLAWTFPLDPESPDPGHDLGPATPPQTQGGRMKMEFGADPFSPPPRKPVLIVLHGEHSTPGRIGRVLRELGAPLDIRRPCFGDPLPKTMCDHSGAVIFGGPMSVNDKQDWLRREIDWIGVALEGEKALSRHLPRRAIARPPSRPSGRLASGRTGRSRLLSDPPDRGGPFGLRLPLSEPRLSMASRRFDRPNGAVLLAQGEDFEAQAIRVGE